MEIFDNLASIGLTTRVLQFIIVGAIAILFVGFFWRFIVIGAGLLFCVVVLAMPNKQDKPIEIKPPQIETVKPDAQQEKPSVEKEPDVAQTDEEMFMEDCVKYGNYTKSQCVALWQERLDDEKKVKFRKTFNRIQMMKVRYGT
jgi:hypothetical protein